MPRLGKGGQLRFRHNALQPHGHWRRLVGRCASTDYRNAQPELLEARVAIRNLLRRPDLFTNAFPDDAERTNVTKLIEGDLLSTNALYEANGIDEATNEAMTGKVVAAFEAALGT